LEKKIGLYHQNVCVFPFELQNHQTDSMMLCMICH